MLSEKLDILRFVHGQPGVMVSAILEHYGMKEHRKRESYIREMNLDGLIQYSPTGNWPFVHTFLTSKGEEILEEEEQKRLLEEKRLKENLEEKAERKREKKFDRIFQVFLVFLGFVLGLIAEHFTGIAGFFITVIHS